MGMAPEIGFLAPDLVLFLDMPPEMVDACQRIEDVQKQLQEIVLNHVLACQKAPKLKLLAPDLVLHIDMPPELQLARHPCSELYFALIDAMFGIA
ncbi:hypothetical protein Ddye_015399 [Dipteronia dyeriana]|uniref:Uncharacterized protein n=1 Tax=Dipteronia dyeriana TaxID=168575 RepID=A0AAD9WZH8_9ROSI|nr:hypothetical protein Ddye_015399 [Dipteronia dyeriana]